MKRLIAFALTALATCFALADAAPPAGATSTFTFYGGGWGHGIGMSQYGAYGMATGGSSYTEILAQYYTGTAVQTVSSPATLRVGLLQWQLVVQLQANGGPISLRLNGANGAVIGTIPDGATWNIQFRTDGRYWLQRPDGSFLGGHGWGGPNANLFAIYANVGTIVRVPDTGHRYNLGQFEFNIYKPCDTCGYRGRLILTVGTNGYVYGIGEVPSSWPVAALEAQAVASRTYAIYKANTSGQHRAGCNCAVYANTSDQVYVGYDKLAGPYGARWKAAADDTAWQAVTYGGRPIAAFYSSSSGGHTESNDAVWGGAPLPYLRGRCDPGDYTPANPNRTWIVQMNGVGVGTRVSAYTGVDIGNATGIAVNSRWGSGRIRSVTVHGTLGAVTMTGTGFRAALLLRSSLVWVNQNLLVTGYVRLLYDHLLCAPGLPIGPATSPPGGRRQGFRNGVIYIDHLRGHNVFLRNGEILNKYRSLGGLYGFLGWPVTGVTVQPWGSRAAFVGGTIFNSPYTAPHESHGLVLAAYLGDGGAAGALGLPVTDVRISGFLRTQTFQHGSITCHTNTGTCTVQG